MDLLVPITLFATTVLAVTWVAERLRLSAPLLLMLVGVLGSVLPFVSAPELTPEFVLVGLLPPLLYAAAVNTSLLDFRDNLGPIGWLSVGLVIFTMVGVGIVTWLFLGGPVAAGLALGAVVAPPDAVAATAVARTVGLPRRVVTVLEGESLVNDATALVCLRTAVLALTASVTASDVAGDFVRAVVVALVVGYAVARGAGLLYRHLPSTPMTTTLSFVVPFAAYAPTEELHGSGVLAVVVAGLVLGHRAPFEQGAEARVAQRVNWRTVQFLLEHSVFLLIGLQARRIVTDAAQSGYSSAVLVGTCAAVLGAVILLRVIWVVATRMVARAKRADAAPLRESLVIAWAGMRGVVTLAAAMALPADIPGRPVLVLAALVVTIGTLLIQGLTLPVLARRLGVRAPDPREDAIQEAIVLQRATAAGLTAAREAAHPGDDAMLARLGEDAERRINGIWEQLGRPDSLLEPPNAGVPAPATGRRHAGTRGTVGDPAYRRSRPRSPHRRPGDARSRGDDAEHRLAPRRTPGRVGVVLHPGPRTVRGAGGGTGLRHAHGRGVCRM